MYGITTLWFDNSNNNKIEINDLDGRWSVSGGGLHVFTDFDVNGENNYVSVNKLDNFHSLSLDGSYGIWNINQASNISDYTIYAIQSKIQINCPQNAIIRGDYNTFINCKFLDVETNTYSGATYNKFVNCVFDDLTLQTASIYNIFTGCYFKDITIETTANYNIFTGCQFDSISDSGTNNKHDTTYSNIEY